MYAAKQKVGDAAATAKEHVDILKAQAEEKAEKSVARTKEEKEIAHERRKAKEAEAKMHMHESKAQHAAEKLEGKHHIHHVPTAGGVYGHHQPVGAHIAPTGHQPVGTTIPPTGGVAPNYPLGGHLH